MANSLITRCPKCSTAFRVGDDVLSMAKGKVRCGQCFHIFDASNAIDSPSSVASKTTELEKATHIDDSAPVRKTTPQPNPISKERVEPLPRIDDETTPTRHKPDEEIVSPDWLDTLFDEEDSRHSQVSKQDSVLEEPTQQTNTKSFLKEETGSVKEFHAYKEPQQPSSPQTSRDPMVNKKNSTDTKATPKKQEEPAPWELELAEVEAALKVASSSNDVRTRQKNENKPPKTTTRKVKVEAVEEPDYMAALHSLAQTASEQTRPSDIQNQHSILDQLSAQQSLAPLLEENAEQKTTRKVSPWLWSLASLLGMGILLAQVATQYFEEGSRSPNFRAFYQTVCSYSGCVLPTFEEVNAISIQHVRIQSHPSLENALLVNAIITNSSNFSQPMPKIALEFFDLNGLPVAARLFAPNDYLHKDFLDITYMPPSTPIHLVIPIQDPGARAVTHQLKALPTDTRSY